MRLAAILAMLMLSAAAAAQTNDAKIAEQKRIIADLERQIGAGEAELAKIRSGRQTAQQRADKLTKQITARARKIEATERQAQLIEERIRDVDSAARSLTADYERNRQSYIDMARSAYRNYRHNNFLTYIFTSSDFADMARRISLLRSVSDMRSVKLHQIEQAKAEIADKRAELDLRSLQLDSVKRDLAGERSRLEKDRLTARNTVKQLSAKEKTALKQNQQREHQLSVAMDELRRLTKGNTEGTSFSNKTSNLRLPVENGRVKRYNGNMAEVTGPKGAHVISIYDGKVVKITRNRITAKYDVYVAHGEYVSTYANLASVSVAEGQKVSRNQQLGVIGTALDPESMSMIPQLIFGIYAPSPNVKMSAANCFKK
ncbi:MAG: peptidoglycan DD-metalloendopeptidase family protein [Alistipes sp.]|nr:peptidoglycan DD-metalloendopeptidase family protein [Alistipes sp.]